jgi:holo-[acyl-carrier protein] synthase
MPTDHPSPDHPSPDHPPPDHPPPDHPPPDGRSPDRPLPIGVPTCRVGVDLTAVADVEQSLATQGERYVHRLFTEHEVASCQGVGGPRAESLAGRFAAKEAVVKVLRPDGVRPEWRDIEVRQQASGACDIVLYGTAAELAASRGIDELSVSLSHEAGMAVAVVVGWSFATAPSGTAGPPPAADQSGPPAVAEGGQW